ncbi:MAG: hypothetical protein AAF586_01855 [Planctomycetota bacterium]
MSDELELSRPLTAEERAERVKTMAGLFKHLIGIDSAGIGLMAFFGERFAGQGWLGSVMLTAVMMFFLISLLGSVYSFWLLTMVGHASTRPDEMNMPRLILGSFVCGFGGFAAAMTLLVALSVRGLIQTAMGVG